MLRQTPSLEATEAFLVAARTPSFRAAAAAMALSPSAFSRRIQMLETFLNAPLFDRSGPRAVLTETGRRYLAAIQPAVEAIRLASSDIRKPVRDSLCIATSHSLAAEWIMPRLGQVQREFGLCVELIVSRDRRTLRDEDVDLAIWGAIEPEAGGGELLVTLDAVPVSASRLIDGRLPPKDIGALLDYPLLSIRNPPHTWPQWLYAAGHSGTAPKADMVYETNQLAYEAASVGLGVVLAIPLLANRYLERACLQPCAAGPAPTGMAYWIHHATPAARRNAKARSFVEWLKEEAAATKESFLTLATCHNR